MANHMQAALDRAKAKQDKKSKSKFGKRRGDQSEAQASGDQSVLPVAESPSVAADTTTPPADAPAPAAPAPADAPKAKKKVSGQVTKWKAQKAFPLEAKITEVAKDNPKRKSAAVRFALYVEGMTVGEYIKKSSDAGNTKALAMADVRWDHVAGFITVV